MYDNLLADVPTDLWIGGKWRKSSDGARFDVIDPATEKSIGRIFVQIPPGERKSGMPHSVEMPAPVNGTITLASSIMSRRRATAVGTSGATM